MEVANAAMECVDSTCISPKLGWQSPRISFCQDIQGDRFSPEKRRRDDLVDDYSSEFEFCMVQNEADPTIFGQTMLTADELFLNGKLLPLRVSPQIIHDEMDDTALPKVAADETTDISQKVSLENAEPSKESSAAAEDDDIETAAILPKSPKLRHRLKEIFKIGKLQVPIPKDNGGEENKKEAKKENHNSVFALKQPLSPRSIWPFSRSSSAGDAKTSSAAFSLASSRSNSDGDTNYKAKASSAPCSRSNSGGDPKLKARNALTSKIHVDFNRKPVRFFSNSLLSSGSDPIDPTVRPAQQDTCPCPRPFPNPPVASKNEGTVKLPETMSRSGVACDVNPSEPTTLKSSKKSNVQIGAKEKRSPKQTSTDGVQGSLPMRNKGCTSPGRNFRMRSPSYGRGSPVRIVGRSGAFSGSPGRVGSSKFMIKNLERCTANSKKSGKSQDSVWPGRQKEGLHASDRTNSFSNGVRVLNVPVCIGHHRIGRTSNNRLFNIRGFFSKKAKDCSVVN